MPPELLKFGPRTPVTPDAVGGTARWDDFDIFYSNDPTSYETTFTEGGAAVAISAAAIGNATPDGNNGP